jgi:signal transduction histidine kinase
MLRRLRWQLTLLYLLAALGLALLVGAGSYALLSYYFMSETDQALDYKMAQLFDSYNLPLPADLANAQQVWTGASGRQPTAQPTSTRQPTQPATATAVAVSGGGEENDEGSPETDVESPHPEDPYDASLAPIFVVPGNSSANPSVQTNTTAPPLIMDQDAAQAADLDGSDRRTVSLADGQQVRLLSYRTGKSGNIPPVIQIGRLLDDQQRILEQFMIGLLFLAALAVIALGGVSWWLSGRSLGPTQKAWEQQQAFVSNASHELRTPLTLIRASAEYGLRSRPPESQAKILQDILDEDEYMNRLVDDLLLLSRLDSRRLALKREAVDLPGLLAEIARQLENVGEEKGVRIELGELQGGALGDPIRLRQVLLILLDNALRYTPSGGVIRMDTRRVGRYQQVRIMDNGKGIPAEYLPHIFERFYQIPSSSAEDARSNGLGLSIAKSLIEAQGGKIKLESQAGVGTTAILLLAAS